MWMVIPPDINNARQLWDVEPKREQVGKDAKILEWKIVDGDNDPYNYSDNGSGGTAHTPPEEPQPVVDETLTAISVWLSKRIDELDKDQYSELSRISKIEAKEKRDVAYAEIEPTLPKE